MGQHSGFQSNESGSRAWLGGAQQLQARPVLPLQKSLLPFLLEQLSHPYSVFLFLASLLGIGDLLSFLNRSPHLVCLLAGAFSEQKYIGFSGEIQTFGEKTPMSQTLPLLLLLQTSDILRKVINSKINFKAKR